MIATASAIWSPSSPKARPSRKRAQLGMAPGEFNTGVHSGQADLTETLVAQRPVERRHGLPQAVDRLTIVTLGIVGICRGGGLPALAGRSPRQPWR